jgi:hypothetical protein
MLSIDSEEDSNSSNVATGSATVPLSTINQISTTGQHQPVICALKQRLLDGIEKVSGSKTSSNSDNVPTTPRSLKNRNRKIVPNSSSKKASAKKRKRKKDCDSSEESDYKRTDSDESD